MARRNTSPHVGCELEQEIIAKVGNNKTKEWTFTEKIYDEKGYQFLGFYTYRHQVCVLDGEMMDVNFSSYSDKIKKLLHENIMGEKYTK